MLRRIKLREPLLLLLGGQSPTRPELWELRAQMGPLGAECRIHLWHGSGRLNVLLGLLGFGQGT